MDKHREVRDEYIQNNTQMTKKVFIQERKKCKSTLETEKINFFSYVLQTAKNDHTFGRTKIFFRVIKQFNPLWKAISVQVEQMLIGLESRAEI